MGWEGGITVARGSPAHAGIDLCCKRSVWHSRRFPRICQRRRRGCSPAFLIDLDSIEAQEDPDNRDGYIAVINHWSVYEASAVTTPVGQNAGLLSLRDRSARASIEPASQAQIQRQVDQAVKRQVSAMEKSVEDWTAENAALEEKILTQTQKTPAGKAAAIHRNGKAAPAAPESTEARLRSVLRFSLAL